MLTASELAVAQLLLQGHNNKEIAAGVNLCEDTVKHYLKRLHEKCKVNEDESRSRIRLVTFLHVNRNLLGIRCLGCDV
jgi:DNA-binding NarL/FixJ family response regulator